MNCKIVTDSSANILSMDAAAFASVPMHIIVGEQNFVDDAQIDLDAMQHALDTHKGKTSTSCPSPSDWIHAFGDADVVFCTTITSALSGSCASAHTAKQMYEAEHPGRIVYVLDTLSAGPEVTLLLEKLQELLQAGLSHETIYQKATEYLTHTHLLFSLASINNLASNGRINPLVAKGVGMLGLRIIGQASDKGLLESLDKVRSDKKVIPCLIKHFKKRNYTNGKVIIAHNHNEAAALALKEAIEAEFGAFHGYIHETRGLCSYYGEPQSMLIGFEA